ncbi:MAG: polyprenyl synthetase family protein [Acidobacteriota bacterium]|nr:polyprenyl synthetase family protein [Acidobacteriota bacterium]
MAATLPKTLPLQVWRKPDKSIPQTQEQRRLIKSLVKDFVAEQNLVPPMPMAELREHAEVFLEQHGIPDEYLDFVAVLMNNESWEDTLATIPYERRLLLMPKCLRKEEVCPAPFDEFGLLCKQCGACSLQDLQEEAERLGYAVLIAEGSALVMAIIETGKIDAIVGVSCLSVLEKAFPFMEAAAIPGIAIPLLQGDCIDTNVDLDWVWDVVHLTSEDKTRRLNLDELRNDVRAWFSPDSLDQLMGPAEGQAEELAREWLLRDGKRWRPFLAACVWRAMQDDPEAEIPDGFKKLAVAVECFHKASLIHDDIEDDDDTRYGQATLHAEWGVPIALNAGDLLIGEGYRLIAESGADPARMPELIRIAAEGQRNLCHGQGAELAWMRDPKVLSPGEVVDIFDKKTSPAFEVALRLGAAYTGCDGDVHEVLADYSRNLGIAYQIKDDFDDLNSNEDPNDIDALRPTMPLALAYKHAKKGAPRDLIAALWNRDTGALADRPAVDTLLAELEIPKHVEALLETYKEHAVISLKTLNNPNLKGLLRRVVGKIFNDIEIKEWCSEFEKRNATSREAVAPIPV